MTCVYYDNTVNNSLINIKNKNQHDVPGKQTSVAADFAIWRCASLPAFPWAHVTLELTFVSMPTSSTVTVSTVTLAMPWKQITVEQLMRFPPKFILTNGHYCPGD